LRGPEGGGEESDDDMPNLIPVDAAVREGRCPRSCKDAEGDSPASDNGEEETDDEMPALIDIDDEDDEETDDEMPALIDIEESDDEGDKD